MAATDGTHTTLFDICKAVSGALAGGEVRLPAWEEVDDLALDDVHAAALQSNLRFVGGELDLQEISCPGGLVANIGKVAKEYIEAKRLRPLRLLLVG